MNRRKKKKKDGKKKLLDRRQNGGLVCKQQTNNFVRLAYQYDTIYRYCWFECRNPRSTASLHSTSLVDSLSGGNGITAIHNVSPERFPVFDCSDICRQIDDLFQRQRLRILYIYGNNGEIFYSYFPV